MFLLTSLLRALVAAPGLSQPTDAFAALGLLFSPPTLWWTLLLTILYIYTVIDAAFTATQASTEEDEFI